MHSSPLFFNMSLTARSRDEGYILHKKAVVKSANSRLKRQNRIGTISSEWSIGSILFDPVDGKGVGHPPGIGLRRKA